MLKPLREFLQQEAAASYALLVAALVALVAANSPLAAHWAALWAYVPYESAYLPTSLKAWVKDALMAVFFFVVGLEMKRELVSGHLRDRQVAKLPLIAALGGMLLPALVFLVITWGQPADAVRGWAIPCATDIAFALGVLGLLGPKFVPAPVKVLLLAIAIFDDLGAMLIIALFYSGGEGAGLSPLHLLLAIGFWATFAGVIHDKNFHKGWLAALPLALAVGLWLALLPSGLHPTIGAVALAAVVPTKKLLPKLEHALHPSVAFGIMPLFALSAAGVDFRAMSESLGSNPTTLSVMLGVALGLLVGKPLGIYGAVWLCEKTGFAKRPLSVTWRHIWGLGAIAGIGFTMSLFVGKLAYEAVHPELLAAAKAGVLGGSILAAGLGAWILTRTREPTLREAPLPRNTPKK
jgi:Na+:H+ antiporter, NhaA family